MNIVMTPHVKNYLSKLGRKGGLRGRGKAKVRGNSKYYAKIAAMRKAKA